MFRSMRRFKQLMEEKDVKKILEEGKTGVLAVQGEEGYPYTIPMNYVFFNGAIYFHGAIDGHKMDAIHKNNKVSFCVVDKDILIPEKFTTRYSSVVAFGRVHLVEEETVKTRIMQVLNRKYSPGYEAKGDSEIERLMERIAVIQMDIDHMTGKASMELINEEKQEK